MCIFIGILHYFNVRENYQEGMLNNRLYTPKDNKNAIIAANYGVFFIYIVFVLPHMNSLTSSYISANSNGFTFRTTSIMVPSLASIIPTT